MRTCDLRRAVSSLQVAVDGLSGDGGWASLAVFRSANARAPIRPHAREPGIEARGTEASKGRASAKQPAGPRPKSSLSRRLLSPCAIRTAAGDIDADCYRVRIFIVCKSIVYFMG
jgi:hypothetical protein